MSTTTIPHFGYPSITTTASSGSSFYIDWAQIQQTHINLLQDLRNAHEEIGRLHEELRRLRSSLEYVGVSEEDLKANAAQDK